MGLICSPETRGRFLVVAIIGISVMAAVVLGVILFELPWSTPATQVSNSNHMKHSAIINVDESASAMEKALAVLKVHPVIDGHNDFPFNLRKLVQNDLRKVNFNGDLKLAEPWASYNKSHTDIPKLREGHVGVQFWVAYTECDSQWKDSVGQTIEQIDVIHRLVNQYSDTLQFCTSVQDIANATKSNKIASLIGVEGGHSIQYSPAILRQMYQLGARYLTLTHSCNTPWADASPVDKKENPLMAGSNGLSPFGLELIDEMNRLGMMIDLSHVSAETMRAALARSKAPVIFSHSASKTLCDHHRNVPDDVLLKLKENGGIIMVNFVSGFIQCNKTKTATLLDVVDHIQHIRDLIGVAYIGLGGDFDGVDDVPVGLENVSKYPHLFAALAERGWTTAELAQLSSLNLLTVMTRVEQVSKEQSSVEPMQTTLSKVEFEGNRVSSSCISSKSLYTLANQLNPGQSQGSTLSSTEDSINAIHSHSPKLLSTQKPIKI